MTRLGQVSESGQKIAEAIATVLKIEVEIIDTDLVAPELSGTMWFRLLRGFVNKHVLQTGNHIFISERVPRDLPFLPPDRQCFYKASIVYPITAHLKPSVQSV